MSPVKKKGAASCAVADAIDARHAAEAVLADAARRIARELAGDLDLENLELLHAEQAPRLVFTFAAEEDDGRAVVVRAETTLDTHVLRATIAPWRKGPWQEAT